VNRLPELEAPVWHVTTGRWLGVVKAVRQHSIRTDLYTIPTLIANGEYTTTRPKGQRIP